LWGLQWAPAPYKTSSAINAVKSIKVDPQTHAMGRKMVSNTVSISGGAFLTVVSAGAASPWLVAGGVAAGEYGVISGSLKMTNVQGSDDLANTLTGEIVGNGIDNFRGGEDNKAEKWCDLGQNLFFTPGQNIIATALGILQAGESAIELGEEYIKQSNDSTNENSSDDNSEEAVNNRPDSSNSSSTEFGKEVLNFTLHHCLFS